LYSQEQFISFKNFIQLMVEYSSSVWSLQYIKTIDLVEGFTTAIYPWGGQTAASGRRAICGPTGTNWRPPARSAT
jgi:hypothetical protein